jgi:exonuclease III
MARNPTDGTTSQKLHSLNILSFNVEGLDSMLLDPGFTQLIQRHDICILSETMRMSDSKLNIENFWDDSQVRPKSEKKGRPSGGVTVLVKTPLRSGIKVVYKSEGLVWIRHNKYFFDFDEDLYICAVYIAPQSSDNVIAKRTDYFNDLLVTTNRYMDLGNVLLAGDFNSRVGNDIIEDDIELPFLSHMLPDPIPLSNLPQRTSCDQVINQHGKKLTQLCNSLNLKIANGR